jgi:hypothetical protein
MAPALVAVLGAPVAWTVHLLASYAVVGLGCAAGWSGPGRSLALVTAICLAAALGSGLLAYRRWRATDAGTDIVLVGVLGTPVFLLAITLEALVPLFLPLCPV